MRKWKIKEILECVACGCEELISVLDLGQQPLANNLLPDTETHAKVFPLSINRCSKCFHVQLTHEVNPELMFTNYNYVTGISKPFVDYTKWFADFCVEYYNLSGNRLSGSRYSTLSTPWMLDIGCNDGTQCKAFKDLGWTTAGIDPASNLKELAYNNMDRHYFGKFFDETTEIGYFDIITAQNVFAHNANPLGMLKGIANNLDENGLAFIQTSQANMIQNNEFDTIYHEHISFFNIKSMRALCERAGLYLIDVIKTPIHGTSYIFIISKNIVREAHIENLINMEKELYDPKTYVEYKEKCFKVIEDFKSFYEKAENIVLIGYGAAAKGITFLNACGTKLDCIIDDTPQKQGKFTPGLGIPIYPIDKIHIYQSSNIIFIPLAWNFFDELVRKIKIERSPCEFTQDYFIKYFPKLEILT